MKKASILKEERASLIAEQQELVNRSDDKLSEEDDKAFVELQGRIKDLNKQVERAEDFEANQARIASGIESIPSSFRIEKKVGIAEKFQFMRTLRHAAANKPLHKDDAAANELAQEKMRSQGFSIPEGNAFSVSMFQDRNQSVTGTSGTKGGELVETAVQLQRPLQPILPVESLGVNVMSGLVGNVKLPVSETFSFAYVAENATVSGTDVVFDGPTLTPHRCAGVVDISRRLIAQTSFSVEQYIIEQINIAYGNAVTLAMLNGSGDAPTGLYSLITSNINTVATMPTHDIIVDLESSIESSDATNVKRAYMCDPKLRGVMKTTAIDSGSGLFLSDGKTLNSYPLMASTLVPTLDTGASHPLIFGDWNQLTVGYWDTLTFIVDPLTQAASGNVRLIIEGYSDVALANEKAFAISKVAKIA